MVIIVVQGDPLPAVFVSNGTVTYSKQKSSILPVTCAKN